MATGPGQLAVVVPRFFSKVSQSKIQGVWSFKEQEIDQRKTEVSSAAQAKLVYLKKYDLSASCQISITGVILGSHPFDLLSLYHVNGYSTS